MIEINRNNYEQLFLDYIEGNLNPSYFEGFKEFLAQNPDLAKELTEFETVELKAETIAFASKQNLKKNAYFTINESNFDEFCISYIENHLTEANKNTLSSYIHSNPDKKNDFELYQKTILKADKNIVFTEKSKLKVYKLKQKNKLYVLLTTAAAAAIGLVIVLHNLTPNKNTGNIVIAKNTEVSSNQKLKTHAIITSSINNKPILHTYKVETKNDNNLIISSLNKSVGAEKIALIEPQKPIEIKQLPNSINTELALISLNKETKVDNKTSNINEADYLTIKEYAMNKVKNSDIIEKFSNIQENKINLLAISKTVLNGFVKLTGIDVSSHNSGNRKTYAFNSEILGFYSSKENK